jgi:hypothetical protein
MSTVHEFAPRGAVSNIRPCVRGTRRRLPACVAGGRAGGAAVGEEGRGGGGEGDFFKPPQRYFYQPLLRRNEPGVGACFLQKNEPGG